jgi:nucleotide-binding universal stress UspA family protein
MKILVTTDFSGNANSALHFAMQMASQTNCELIFFHGLEMAKTPVWLNADFYSYTEEEIETVKTRLEKLVIKKYHQYNLPQGKYSCCVEVGLNIQQLVLDFSKQIRADFICIGTRGAGGLKKIIGTTTSGLITSSPVPLIVVPKSYKSKPVSSIWYASDLDNIEKELKKVNQFSRLFKASVHIYNYNYLQEPVQREKTLQNIATKFRMKITNFHLKKMDPYYPLSYYILKDVRKAKPSMLALFTKQNRSWYERLFLSSKTAEISFNSNIPLLVFRK